VLVTGHTGFKGSWLSIWLNLLGANVCGIGLAPTTKYSNYEVSSCARNMKSIIGDIRDEKFVKKSFENFQPDILFHLAAQPLVGASYINPKDTFETNIMGLINVLESAKLCASLRVLVNVTSDKCYESKDSFSGHRESDPLGGRDPYSASKACSELVSASYQHSFFAAQVKALATVRAGNVIGGGDWTKGRLIPDVIESIEENKSLVLRFPDAVRPWQHVLEPLSGYLILAEKLWNQPKEYVGAWNFGPSMADAQTVQSVALALLDKLSGTRPILIEGAKKFHETRLLKLDISKAQKNLNWQPKLSLMQTLDSIVWWQDKFLRGKNMLEVCQAQIEEYSNG